MTLFEKQHNYKMLLCNCMDLICIQKCYINYHYTWNTTRYK